MCSSPQLANVDGSPPPALSLSISAPSMATQNITDADVDEADRSLEYCSDMVDVLLTQGRAALNLWRNRARRARSMTIQDLQDYSEALERRDVLLSSVKPKGCKASHASQTSTPPARTKASGTVSTPPASKDSRRTSLLRAREDLVDGNCSTREKTSKPAALKLSIERKASAMAPAWLAKDDEFHRLFFVEKRWAW